MKVANFFLKLLVFTIFSINVFAKINETSYSSSKLSVPNISQGNFQVSGGVSYTDSRYQSSFSMYPSFSYFVADQVSVGATLSYFSSSSKGKNSDVYTSYGIGPSFNYYFNPINQIVPFVGAVLSFNTSKYRESSSVTYFIPSIGAQYFFTSELSFGLALVSQVEIQRSSGENDSAVNSLQGSFGYYF